MCGLVCIDAFGLEECSDLFNQAPMPDCRVMPECRGTPGCSGAVSPRRKCPEK